MNPVIAIIPISKVKILVADWYFCMEGTFLIAYTGIMNKIAARIGDAMVSIIFIMLLFKFIDVFEIA